MNKPFNVAIMGCGVVGSGVADILTEQEQKLSARFGRNVALRKILDVRDFSGSPYEKFVTKDAADILDNPEIDAVVVTIGGLEFAGEMCRKALDAGKHVVTSNKEVVAAYGRELTRLAFDRGVRFLYEASAGGGIPIIRPLNICLRSNDVTEIRGILNGTTNYILTRMEEAGIPFADALKEAQAKGYAEADPTADVDGYDAARKIAILSSVAYDRFVDYRNVPCTGIRNITREDISFAESFGGKIKLIAGSVVRDGKAEISVEPMLVMENNLLSAISGVYNAVLVRGSYTDYTLFYGQGAGKSATASAVCGDLIEILSGGDKTETLPEFVDKDAALTRDGSAACRRYLRIQGAGDGALTFGVNASFFYDKESDALAVLTQPLTDGETEELSRKISAAFGVDGPAIALRVLE